MHEELHDHQNLHDFKIGKPEKAQRGQHVVFHKVKGSVAFFYSGVRCNNPIPCFLAKMAYGRHILEIWEGI